MASLTWSMDPSCFVSAVHATGGVTVCGLLPWHTLGPLEPNDHNLTTMSCPTVVADHVSPCHDDSVPIFRLLPSAMSHSSKTLKLFFWSWQRVHCTQMTSTVKRSQSNIAPLGWSGTEDSNYVCAADKSTSIWTKISEENFQHVVESVPRSIMAVLNVKGVQLSIGKGYVMKCQASISKWPCFI